MANKPRRKARKRPASSAQRNSRPSAASLLRSLARDANLALSFEAALLHGENAFKSGWETLWRLALAGELDAWLERVGDGNVMFETRPSPVGENCIVATVEWSDRSLAAAGVALLHIPLHDPDGALVASAHVAADGLLAFAVSTASERRGMSDDGRDELIGQVWELFVELTGDEQFDDELDDISELLTAASSPAAAEVLGVIESLLPERGVVTVVTSDGPAPFDVRRVGEHAFLWGADGVNARPLVAALLLSLPRVPVIVRSFSQDRHSGGLPFKDLYGLVVENEAGRLEGLSEAELFNACCIDASSGEPIAPEPAVRWLGAEHLSRDLP